ncbi:hypothetical protein GPECTOR_1g102 [Gonium pectorale]|uniref:Uncharacterized protein n=1 Tax=Gonium pectorale TaxID=33097 RepID=A0A150H2C9_GONPE|nr:hypothetical protein GPECTOR_1g102 [Gonium pectorale]|eukprot:KXZ56122.1 hypothetical protein GPECTOR_1g102 [Gonium pectorale]
MSSLSDRSRKPHLSSGDWKSRWQGEVQQDNPSLDVELRVKVIKPLLRRCHPNMPINPLTTKYVLRMRIGDHDAVYVHVGLFTDDVMQRFSLGLLRSNIGGRGAGVKPIGYGNAKWFHDRMTPVQQNIMEQVLDYMAGELRAMRAAPAAGQLVAMRPPAGMSDLNDRLGSWRL